MHIRAGNKVDMQSISSDNAAPHLGLGAVSYVGRSVGKSSHNLHLSAPLHARLRLSPDASRG